MLSLRELTKSSRVQRSAGLLAAHYLRLVWFTSRVTIEPADIYVRLSREAPIILAMWHGQHFLTPMTRWSNCLVGVGADIASSFTLSATGTRRYTGAAVCARTRSASAA